MRIAALIAPIAIASSSSAAAQEYSGSYDCIYVASWGCSLGPDGGCISRGAPRTERNRLRVNFDTRRISLNGLNGHIELQRLDYWVYWHVGGFGIQQLSMRDRDGVVVLELRLENRLSASATVGEFRCRRT